MVAVTAQPAPPTEMAPDYEKSRTLFLSLLFLATVAPLVLMPLLARISPASTSIQSVTNLMIFLGANGHVATTFFFYTDRPLKSYMREHRGRYLVAPLALVLVTGLLYHSLGVAYTSYILLYYFSWQTYHYMRQNYGILAFVSAATDTVRLHWLEKVILNLGVIAGILVLPPSTVTQAARSSSTIGVVGSRLGTAHVIAPMLTNKDGGRHTNTSRKVSRRVASPACIAGVRVSRPNFNALWGRTKL